MAHIPWETKQRPWNFGTVSPQPKGRGAGGSALAGESSRAAASRELWEETGLVVSPDAPTPIGRFVEASALLDCYTASEPSNAELKLQASEVAASEWVAASEVERRVGAGVMAGTLKSAFSSTVYVRVMPSYEGSDGSPLHFDDVGGDGSGGETEPIVLLAGGAARHPSYLGDLAGLSERRRLIVPHLRGVGRTAMPDSEERGSFWTQADDLECLRIHLGLQRAVLVAHSAGTRLAIAYAAQFTRSLARMVLITPPATYLVDEASDTGTLSERRHGDSSFEAAYAALIAGPQTNDDDGYNAWQQESAPAGYAKWGAKERAHAQVGRWSLAATKAYFSVAPPSDLAPRLRQVGAPVLVLAGAEDCLTGVAPVTALARLFPSGVSVVVENSGHYPWVEQPAAFREAIDVFLKL